jgi:hypothetical protein
VVSGVEPFGVPCSILDILSHRPIVPLPAPECRNRGSFPRRACPACTEHCLR